MKHEKPVNHKTLPPHSVAPVELDQATCDTLGDLALACERSLDISEDSDAYLRLLNSSGKPEDLADALRPLASKIAGLGSANATLANELTRLAHLFEHYRTLAAEQSP